MKKIRLTIEVDLVYTGDLKDMEKIFPTTLAIEAMSAADSYIHNTCVKHAFLAKFRSNFELKEMEGK